MKTDPMAANYALAEAFGLPTEVVVPVHWEGSTVVVFAELDHAELRRRANIGFGWERDRRTIEVLAELATTGASGSGEVLLRQRAEWAFDRGGLGDLVARPAIGVAAIVVAGSHARATISRASSFAPLGRRIALLDRRRRDQDDLVVRASWLEVGVAVAEEGSVERLAEPGPRCGDDLAYRWWFSELVLAAHLDLSVRQRRHPSTARRVC